MVELTIPAGTTPDTVLMMRKRGVQVSALEVELEVKLEVKSLVSYFSLYEVLHSIQTDALHQRMSECRTMQLSYV
jgi:hypothetical protein